MSVIHLRTDDNPLNKDAVFACAIKWPLPEGDRYVFDAEVGLHHLVDCPGCTGSTVRLGTPLSQISTQPGNPGYAEWLRISRSWGHE